MEDQGRTSPISQPHQLQQGLHSDDVLHVWIPFGVMVSAFGGLKFDFCSPFICLGKRTTSTEKIF
jgi:hypothetical protein